jgi:hypothetical protein
MTLKVITTIGDFISNPKGLHYFIKWIGTSRIKKLCVVCTTKVNWYYPTSDDTIVFLGAYFVKLNSTFA